MVLAIPDRAPANRQVSFRFYIAIADNVIEDFMAIGAKDGYLLLDAAKLGQTDKLQGMKRLDTFARAIEQSSRAPEADVAATIAHERQISSSLNTPRHSGMRMPLRSRPSAMDVKTPLASSVRRARLIPPLPSSP